MVVWTWCHQALSTDLVFTRMVTPLKAFKKQNPRAYRAMEKQRGCRIAREISCVRQLCPSVCVCMHSFPHIIFPHVVSQETGYSSLCCIAVPHSLSILTVIVSLPQHQMTQRESRKKWHGIQIQFKLQRDALFFALVLWGFFCCFFVLFCFFVFIFQS